MPDMFLHGFADLVAAIWVWVLLVVATVCGCAGMYGWGYWRGRQARGRARVLAAVHLATSETVVLPAQREASR